MADPSITRRRRRKPPAERFWKKVDRKGPNGCWLWTAGQTSTGYGKFERIKDDGRRVTCKAHRFSFLLHGGALLPGHHLHHVCGVSVCVNPQHLQQVTPKEHRALTPKADLAAMANIAKAQQWRRDLTGCVRHGHPLKQNGRVRYCRICATARRVQRRIERRARGEVYYG
jgi:hypothetical protein